MKKRYLVLRRYLKALSDPTRVQILNLLQDREYSVNEIARTLAFNQTTVSHQLRF